MEYIYALKCQKNKYYIGKTYNVQIEYNQHLDGTFCDITKEFKPCDIDSIFELTDDITLNLVISKYVIKYGKENIFFEDTDIKIIKKLIKQKNTNCVCEEKHWLTECKLNLKDEFWNRMLNKIFSRMTSSLQARDICIRCGRYGHDMEDCYSKKHIDGYDLDDYDENEPEFIN